MYDDNVRVETKKIKREIAVYITGRAAIGYEMEYIVRKYPDFLPPNEYYEITSIKPMDLASSYIDPELTTMVRAALEYYYSKSRERLMLLSLQGRYKYIHIDAILDSYDVPAQLVEAIRKVIRERVPKYVNNVGEWKVEVIKRIKRQMLPPGCL